MGRMQLKAERAAQNVVAQIPRRTGFFQCFFCLKKGKRQVKAFQKIIEIFAGIRNGKKGKKFLVCCSRKRDLLQCGKFFCNIHR